MPSKQVTDRQKSAGAVFKVVDTYRPRLADGIRAVTGDPAAAAAALALAAAGGAQLAGSATRLVAADEAHAVELADDAGLRATRETAVAALRERLIRLREALVGMYGNTTPGAVGFVGSTPEDPVVLVRYGRQVAQGLRKPNVLPAPRFPTAVLIPTDEAGILDGLARDLAVAIEAVAEDQRENQVTRTARDAAMAAHDQTFSRTANLLVALYDFAGEPELADRVRPSVRSPGRLAADAEAGADADDATTGADPTTEDGIGATG
ncbi:MAG: hypothetical protein ABMB14_31470 [Myxococcota bacterium]